MGACFTVNLELTFLDEAAAVKAMQEYIHILAKIETHIYMCNILRSQKESDSFLKVTFVSILCFSHENPAKSKSDNTIILYKARTKKFILSCRIP